MKAISVKQPWASLIAAGVKTLELRTWPTHHRGALLICSSRRPMIDGHRHGEALCVVDLVDCRPMTQADVPFACVGQFYRDQWVWVLKNVQSVDPFSVVGRLRLFNVADELIRVERKKAKTPA